MSVIQSAASSLRPFPLSAADHEVCRLNGVTQISSVRLGNAGKVQTFRWGSWWTVHHDIRLDLTESERANGSCTAGSSDLIPSPKQRVILAELLPL